MKRVARRNPCPICGRPDWCLVSEDGSAAICARVEEGSVKKCGEAGWLHRLGPDRVAARPAARRHYVALGEPPPRDFGALSKHCRQRLTDGELNRLAAALGVSAAALRRLGTGWNGVSFTFPMREPSSKIIGIRTRYPSGFKAAEKGSRQGLFVPADLPGDGVLVICEGATDTAAALDLGLAAVGRPSCSCGAAMLVVLAKGRGVVIIGDNDPPGRRGAESLASALTPYCPTVRVVYPPDGVKDLRQWKLAGLTAEGFAAALKAAQPCKLTISSRSLTEAGRKVRHGR